MAKMHVSRGAQPNPLQRSAPQRLTTPKDLVDAGLAAPERLHELEAVAERYAIGLTPALTALVRPEDPSDPIARQFLPDLRELIRDPAERDDPIGDDAMSPVKGLVHRYPDRVLIKLVAVCAVYCRFCFRRERVGPGSGALSAAEFAAAFDYVRADQGIWEVILTGGDPLTLSPRRIAEVTQALAAIGHVKVLRWHTRLPVAAPERVTKAMARALVAEGKTTVVAVHANHARELTESARLACRRLAAEGAMLVSQSVLLKGVNDDAETLIDLMRAFVEARVKPYYLHHGDLAPGTAHWRVPIARGQELMRSLRARLSGLATPTYMLDIPGGHGKAPIGPQWIESENGEHVVTDPQGIQHGYADRLGADG
jgi:lysine 2,3-aminomutase